MTQSVWIQRDGLLQFSVPIGADAWFFPYHFHGDPVMPGSLGLEGCFQALAFILGAFGVCGGARQRCEPMPRVETSLRLLRQITPESRDLTYDVHVRSFRNTDGPVVHADIIGRVNGQAAFVSTNAVVRMVRF